ncbi:hypothetical protein ACC702_39115, partial [Rhizobium ruizarguesonis]
TGITIKEDRKQKVDFSDPYMRSHQFMLLRGDEKRFADAKSFAEGFEKLDARVLFVAIKHFVNRGVERRGAGLRADQAILEFGE